MRTELGMLDAVVVQEQLGRSVCPTAFTARSVVAPFLLNELERKSWLQDTPLAKYDLVLP